VIKSQPTVLIIRSCLISLVILLACSPYARAQKTGGASASALKTALIYNFTRNLYWPEEDRMTEFRICVMNSERLTDQLKELEKAARFRKRLPFKVVLCGNADQLGQCQMVVVDGSTGENLWSLYARIRNKPILMVAENLQDYKKAMVSFIQVDRNVKYIVNKTKFDECGLTARPEFFASAITKEGEWKSIFEKFSELLKSTDKQVKVDKDDIAQMVNAYKTLEQEKKGKEYTINQMEDSLRSKMVLIGAKMEEYRRLNAEIEKQKTVLDGLTRQMSIQKRAIRERETENRRQRTVIIVIALLTAIVVILLLLAIRVNRQRRMANKMLSLQKSEIERQKHLVEIKQKEILDSIAYAKRIQTALMASENLLNDCVPEHFVFFRPKDIVAGDFYWAESVDNVFMYATADSTGHGVPGAFMSLLNISKLNEAINQKKITRPDLVLNDVKREIVDALNPEGSTEESKDGMDVVLCRLDLRNMVLQYAAANSGFCIIRKNDILECKADKMPVGKSHDTRAFTLNEIKLQPGDMIYTFTDGFADQFGGPHGKKLKFKYLKNVLVKISALPLDQQKNTLDRYFEDWKGVLEQVDDVLLMGIRV
jgi:serine phosphatase RsbU (regulator of sigma subunit)